MEKININDIRKFREFIKTKIRGLKDDSRNIDFIGYKTNDNQIFGYFDIVHGDKQDIDNFLTTFLEIANDWQVISEFIQNAIDADAENIAIIYDQNYLIFFNDGKKFSPQEIRSILNIAQSTKSKDKIGKFGIGFKIIHRLIGETNGISELKNLIGPIIFSWSDSSHLKKFLNLSSIEEINFIDPKFYLEGNEIFCNSDSPWLFKVILTAFPCGLNEEIYDLNYETTKAFTFDELKNFIVNTKNYLFKKNLSEIEQFNQGTIVYIPVNFKKLSLLNQNISDDANTALKVSLSIFNFLNKSNNKDLKLYINNLSKPIEPLKLKLSYFEISDDEIEKENNNQKIKIIFGYQDLATEDPYILKKTTNLYYYFPIEDEKYEMNFICHSDAFYNLSDRTRLARHERNEKILNRLSGLIKEELDKYKREKNIRDYSNLYASLLSSNWDKGNWIYENFLKDLINYLRNNIPSKETNFVDKNKVKINTSNIPYLPRELDQNLDFEWFYYDEEQLIREARNNAKLGLAGINLLEIIEKLTDIKNFNELLKKDKNLIQQTKNEINTNASTELLQANQQLKSKIEELKIFDIDGNLFSIRDSENDIFIFLPSNDDNLAKIIKSFNIPFFSIQDNNDTLTNLIKSKFDWISKNNNNFLNLFKKILNFLNEKKNYDKDSIDEFISFFEKRDIPTLKHITIISNEEHNRRYIKFKLNNPNTHNYYSENDEIINFIENKIPQGNLFLLDKEIYSTLKHKDAVLTNNTLITYLIDNYYQEKTLIEIIINCNSKNIQEYYLQKINKITLNLNEGEKSFFEKLLLLNYELKVIKDTDIQIKTLNNDDKSYILSELKLEQVLTVKIKEEEYSLDLTELIEDYKERATTLERLKEIFSNLERRVKNYYFELNQEEKKHNEEILKTIKKVLSEKKIINNSYEIAFLLLFNTEEEIKNNNYLVFLRDHEEPVKLEIKEYVLNQDISYIEDQSILSFKLYQGISKVLRLDEKNYFINPSNKIMVLKSPTVLDNCLYIGNIKKNLDVNERKELLNALFKTIANTKAKKISIPEKVFDALKIFDPSKYIYPCEYALEEEKLSDFILENFRKEDEEEKLRFFELLGVNTINNLKVELRQVLKGERNLNENDVRELANFIDNENEINYFINTLIWLHNQQFEFSNSSPKYTLHLLKSIMNKIINNISEIRIKKLIFPFIKNILNNLVIFSLKELSVNDNNEIIKVNSKNLSKSEETFINKYSNSFNFITDDFNIENFDKLSKSLKIVEFSPIKLIDIDQMLKNSEECISDIYIEWKKYFYEKYKVNLKILVHKNGIIYKKIFYNEIIEFIQEMEKFDFYIDRPKNEIYIFIVNDSHDNILSALEILPEIELNECTIQKNELFNKYKEFQQNSKEIREKNYSEIFENPIEHSNSELLERAKYFQNDDEKIANFKTKLIELLHLDFNGDKPWAGKIYHFTHIENAVEIILNKKILSREKAVNFKDSAGEKFISQTHEEIKKFARFYFRPLTATQYYNEHLGAVTKLGDLPQCPIPIFFVFSIKEVMEFLEKHDRKYYISNNNLRHYPKAEIGNDYEFLKKFDFINIYKKYEECHDPKIFLRASSQEFIVEDELNLKELKDIEIICEDEYAKETLLNLLSKKLENNPEEIENIKTKIRINKSFYYNYNSHIKFERNEELNSFKIQIYDSRPFDKLWIKFNYQSNSKNFEIILNDFLILENYEMMDFEVYYLNENTNKTWLVYKHVSTKN
ncbi:MAG: DarT ssDNA thymidine ADP-ribosyltransferase family protein [Ignavibacterium sp.]|nr:DarT ssDNA thymidine ADP-ribosyltransferase family protein [Ignavibacterium sp.]